MVAKSTPEADRLHLRGVDPELLLELKLNAVRSGLTLREIAEEAFRLWLRRKEDDAA